MSSDASPWAARSVEEGCLNPSLSVLLPVHNAQTTLGANVHRVLEVLPELTRAFEVIVVDDGSADATCEIADELARSYPQVKALHLPTRVGWAAAVAKHAVQATGDFLMIHCAGAVEPADIAGLWRVREGIAAAAVAKAKAAQTGRRLRIDPQSHGSTLARMARQQETTILNGLGLHVRGATSSLLLIHRLQLPKLEQQLKEVAASIWGQPQGENRRRSSRPMTSPTFLSRLTSFTLGE